jgi:uroporphyrinogen-III synthase
LIKNRDKKDTAVMSEIVSKRILITQPRPESDKSPYFELAKRHDVEMAFLSFIRLEGIPSKDFRRQKVEIGVYSAVIFTSRHAIDHFFRTAEEMKISISQDTKYFCVTEAVALYLQKFILYRKRKVFYGADGTNKSMLDVINKHKENEKFLYPTSENQQDNEIVNWLKSNHCEFATPYMYRSISNDIRELFSPDAFDIICFFTPSGVKSLFDNFPHFKQNGTLIGAFGTNTTRAAEQAGLVLEIRAPEPMAPSMVSAIEKYLSAAKKRL